MRKDPGLSLILLSHSVVLVYFRAFGALVISCSLCLITMRMQICWTKITFFGIHGSSTGLVYNCGRMRPAVMLGWTGTPFYPPKWRGQKRMSSPGHLYSKCRRFSSVLPKTPFTSGTGRGPGNSAHWSLWKLMTLSSTFKSSSIISSNLSWTSFPTFLFHL